MEMATRDRPPLPSATGAPTGPVHWADRLDRRLLVALTVVGFAIPVIAYLGFLHHYAINTMDGDQWDDVTVIRQSYLHGFDWSSLWAQHNENRILFPNLIVILLARTTHFNVKIEEYLSAAMLIAAMTFLILALRRRAPSIPLLYYCPLAFLGFSFVQWSNTTWGFQIAWYLILLALMVAIYALDRPRLTWWLFGLAVVAAVVGSFSSSQGLLIWPAGLVLLYHRRRPYPYAVAWIGMALVTAALYFHNYQSSPIDTSPHIFLEFPLPALKMYLFALGDVVGIQVHFGQGTNLGVLLLGGVTFALAITLLILYGPHRDVRGGSPIGLSLICVGLLFDALITEGRFIFGYVGASGSRYTTMDLLVPMGIYLTLIDRSPRARPEMRVRPGMETGAATSTTLLDPSALVPTPEVELPASPSALDRLRQLPKTMSVWADGYLLAAARVVIMAIIVIQVAVGLPNGLQGARDNYVYQAKGAEVLRTIDHQSDVNVRRYLYLFRSAPFIRQQAKTLEHYHLNVFAP